MFKKYSFLSLFIVLAFNSDSFSDYRKENFKCTDYLNINIEHEIQACIRQAKYDLEKLESKHENQAEREHYQSMINSGCRNIFQKQYNECANKCK
jgi:hypothetical protein